MSKEQVSGSLTLSLGGLADEVAGEVVTRLASTLRELAGPPPLSIVGTIRFLVGYGIPHEQAQGIANALAGEGRALAIVPFPDRSHQVALPDTSAPESAVAWFEREVGL